MSSGSKLLVDAATSLRKGAELRVLINSHLADDQPVGSPADQDTEVAAKKEPAVAWEVRQIIICVNMLNPSQDPGCNLDSRSVEIGHFLPSCSSASRNTRFSSIDGFW